MMPPEVAKTIEQIVKSGANAKVSCDKKGQYHVYEEKVKKVLGFSQSEKGELVRPPAAQ